MHKIFYFHLPKFSKITENEFSWSYFIPKCFTNLSQTKWKFWMHRIHNVFEIYEHTPSSFRTKVRDFGFFSCSNRSFKHSIEFGAICHRFCNQRDAATCLQRSWIHYYRSINTQHIFSVSYKHFPPEIFNIISKLRSQRSIIPSTSQSAINLASWENKPTSFTKRSRVAASFERGVRLPIDDVEALIVSGHVPQSSASAGHQNHVVGGAVAAAAMQFAEGGYTTVIDGCIFPEVLPEFGQACRLHGVELHYAVLRAGFEVCLERAARRNEGSGFVTDPAELRLQWDRFTRLGDYDAHVLDASDAPAAVADRLLASFASGRLRVPAGG